MKIFKWMSNKALIIIAGMILVLYLILILAVSNFSQSRLQESQQSELQLKVAHYVNSLSYFFKVSSADIDVLAEDQKMSTFFANRSSGMSMKYGLGSSLSTLNLLVNKLIVNSKMDNTGIYERILLVGLDGEVFVDSALQVSTASRYFPVIEKNTANLGSQARMMVLDTPRGLAIKIVRPIFQQKKRIAYLIAGINLQLIIDQLTGLEHAESGSHLQLSTPSGKLFIWDSSTLSPANFLKGESNKLYIEKNIKGTPLKLLAWFDTVNKQDTFTSDWFIWAISLLAFPVVIGLYYLLRIEHSNTVLKTQVTTSVEQRKILAKQNSVLRQEVNRRLESEEKLAYQATHDELTGLTNRNYSNQRLAQVIEQSRRSKSKVLLMLIDLDNFKLINDTLGHDAGDKVLQFASTRLLNTVRKTDTVARLGGDEFLLIIPELADNSCAELLASKVKRVFEPPITFDNNELFISSSIGMSIYPQDGASPEVLLKNADMALYRVKETGRNSFSFYDTKMNEALLRNHLLNTRLRLAMNNNVMEMYYQPIIDLQTRKIVGAEALIRWFDSELGFISPEEFIPLAESNGLINLLGEFAFKEACSQAVLWQKYKTLTIAVNFSSVQFRHCDILLQTVNKTLKETGLSANLLDIEVTESLLVNDSCELVGIFKSLQQQGIRLSIDDFGTGYSSLSYLQKYSFSKLKIDRAFIRQLETNPADLSLVKAILAMAKALNLKVVAEGVEDDFQADLLQQLGCDHAQGYLFSRAVTSEQFVLLLEQQNAEVKLVS